MGRIKRGEIDYLVATDIAARGLDIPTVSHVFNYDLPDNPEDYVHRAGRTARAEGTGFAFCLVAPEDIDLYNILEEHIGKDMFNWTSHPGFDYLNEPESTGKVRINRGRDRSRPGGGTSARVKRLLGRPIDAKEDESTAASVEPPPLKPAFGRRRTRSPRRAGR